MNIRNTIAAVNQMQADGVIERYAIGGAVGPTFYLEPVATLDVDVFIAFRPVAGSLLISLMVRVGPEELVDNEFVRDSDNVNEEP